jgi:amino acid transporter
MCAGAPLDLGALRHQKPNAERPYRLSWGPVLAPASFIFASFIIYWSGWEVDWKLIVAVILGYVLMGISRIARAIPVHSPIDWAAAIWLWPHLVMMTLISYLGQFGGGREVILFTWTCWWWRPGA